MENKSKLLCTLILLIFITSIVIADPVPKSETIVIQGQLNDTKQNAQDFNQETEYVFGTTSSQSMQRTQTLLSMETMLAPASITREPDAWRKTTFTKAGTLVITLNYEKDSNYSIEFYNSCSNKNFCDEYEFGTYKTCTMNIQPGTYYFKIINLYGNSKYYLDVDLIENKQNTKINAWECTQVACSQDQDCGTEKIAGEKYCQGNSIYQKYSTVKCTNPGKDNAACLTAKENRLIEECITCDKGKCIEGLFLECPMAKIDYNYLFSWNANDYNLSNYLEFAQDRNFKTKISVATKTNPTPIAKQFKTIAKYEASSKEKNVYSRIKGKTKSGKTGYSNICEFTLIPPIEPMIYCPTEAINDNYFFDWKKGENTESALLIGNDSSFSKGTYSKINPGKNNLVSVTKNFQEIIKFESKSTTKTLYAKITGKDKYERKTESETCSFSLKQPEKPVLDCPLEPVDSNYSFTLSFGDYNKTSTLEFSYDLNFKTKTKITATKKTIIPIKKQFTTLKKYSLKTSTGILYARIYSIDKYGRMAYSNTCNFTLKKAENIVETTNTETQNPNQTEDTNITTEFSRLFFPAKIQFATNETTIIDSPEQTTIKQISSQTNSKNNLNQKIIETNNNGKKETGVIYEITENFSNQAQTTAYSSAEILSTCQFNYTDSTQCDSQWRFYQIKFSSTTKSEARYRFIDCTTGAILGKGQICPEEYSSKHYRPEGHPVKFELDYYTCPNNQCKIETINLCSGVTCPNYCWAGTKYFNGTCNQGVCNYSNEICPNNSCTNGSCQANCPGGCTPYCSGNTLYYDAYCSNSKCTYTTSIICTNGCSNGTCNSNTCTTGWKCYDSQTKAYQNTDCTWSNKTNCSNGCSNGSCLAPSCTAGWKCKTPKTKAYQYSDCGWGNTTTYCGNGCLNGACIPDPQPGDTNYCTAEKPCKAGQGNCKKNNDCETGLRCVEDAGAKYGYSSTTNVCEAAPNIYNESGWQCKDPNTMAYKFSDGTWGDELLCKHGCSNGSCFMPTFCDATTNNLTQTNQENQTLFFSGIDNQQEKVKNASFFAPIVVGAVVVDTVFLEVAGISFIAIIGTMLITNTELGLNFIPWPEYDDWTSPANLTQHFNDHKDEFGFKFEYEFEDACKRNYENRDSFDKQKFIEPDTGGGKVFIVRDTMNNMVSMVNEFGKMISCYSVGEDRLNSKIRNKEWKQILTLPNCIVII